MPKNALCRKTNEEVNTISSLEVAEMMEIRHSDILQKLEGTTKADGTVKTKGIIPILTERNFPLSDYFIESTYIDGSGKKNKCYDCTKMGCDFLANKFTGEKGIIFTAKYVKRFNEMEQEIKRNLLPTTYRDAVAQLLESLDKQAEQQEKLEYQEPLVQLAETRIEKKGCFSLTDATKSLQLKRGQITRWAKEEGYIHKTQIEVNKAGEQYFKVYSSDAKHNQIGITENGLILIKSKLDEIRRS